MVTNSDRIVGLERDLRRATQAITAQNAQIEDLEHRLEKAENAVEARAPTNIGNQNNVSFFRLFDFYRAWPEHVKAAGAHEVQQKDINPNAIITGKPLIVLPLWS